MLVKGLVVLALDLQLGLEFLHQELETGDFGFQLDDVWARGRRAKTLDWRRGGPRRESFG